CVAETGIQVRFPPPNPRCDGLPAGRSTAFFGPITRRDRFLAPGDRWVAALRGSLMPKRIASTWPVVASIENAEHDRGYDLLSRPDGRYGFEEFRRDAEDAGAWTPVQYYSDAVFASRDMALAAAAREVAWLPRP